jgi:hypothetical protein
MWTFFLSWRAIWVGVIVLISIRTRRLKEGIIGTVLRVRSARNWNALVDI